MSRARRVLSTCLVAATLAAGLAPLTAMTARAIGPDPAGTITLASGPSATQYRTTLVGRSSLGALVTLSGSGVPGQGRLVPLDGSTPTDLPWLPSMGGLKVAGSMLLGSVCAPTCTGVWHDLATGASGSITSRWQDVLAATPDGWVYQYWDAQGMLRLFRVVAATGEQTTLDVPMPPKSGEPFTALGGEDGLAVTTQHTLWVMPWDRPGQFTQLPMATDDQLDALRATAAGAVLYRVIDAKGQFWLVRSAPDGETARIPQATAAVDAVLTTTDIVWNDNAAVSRVPLTGGTPEAVDLGAATGDQVAGIASTGDGIVWAIGSGTAGHNHVDAAPVSNVAHARRLLDAPQKPLSTGVPALGPGRVAWSDDRLGNFATFERTVFRDGDTLQVGQERELPPTYVPTALPSISGDRTAYSSGGTGIVLEEGDPGTQPLEGLVGNGTVSGRWLLDARGHLMDLPSMTVTQAPTAGPRPALWGHYLAWAPKSSEVWVRDLLTGTDRVVARTLRGPSFALWGNTVAWHDTALHWMDVTSGATSTIQTGLPAGGRVALSGSYVAYTTPDRGSGSSAVVYPLTDGATAPTLQVEGVRSLALDGSLLAWVSAEGEPKLTPLPHVAEPPRWIGAQGEPADWAGPDDPWKREWTFTQPLTTCAVVLRLGATVERRLPCQGHPSLGTVTVTWDGRDDAGGFAPSGAYTWTVEAAGADGPVTGPDGTGAAQGPLEVHSVHRLEGPDRFGTAAAVSRQTFAPGAPVAYVADGLDFPDALSAAPAASHQRGPVLLTRPGALPAATAAELARLKPRRIVVLGSTAAVSATVATRLKGYTAGSVTRLAGADRFATSAAVSRATYAAGAPVAYVANGLNYPDALSGAPAAGHQGGPVLLTPAGSLPSAVVTELARLKPRRIVVLGSAASVSSALASRLTGYTTGTVTRLAGADRFATSAAISRASWAPGVETAYVANGAGFADALAGSPAAGLPGLTGGPLLLIRDSETPTVVATELKRLKPKRVVVLGASFSIPLMLGDSMADYTS